MLRTFTPTILKFDRKCSSVFDRFDEVRYQYTVFQIRYSAFLISFQISYLKDGWSLATAHRSYFYFLVKFVAHPFLKSLQVQQCLPPVVLDSLLHPFFEVALFVADEKSNQMIAIDCNIDQIRWSFYILLFTSNYVCFVLSSH